MRPGTTFQREDVRPAGHVFFIPPEGRAGDDPKNRPHFLLNHCDPAADPNALGTLAHMSTKATELTVYGSPGHRLTVPTMGGASRESFVVAARLLARRPESLTRSAFSMTPEVGSVRHSVRRAIGLGEGIARPGSDSVRGRLVRVTDPEVDFPFGFVLTAHRYSAQRRYQVVVPLIDRVLAGEDGPGVDLIEWDVLPGRPPWSNAVPLEEPLLDTSALVTLTERWRKTSNVHGWLPGQIEITSVAIDAETLAAIEMKVAERLELER